MRILAIDPGTVRIGIAISDPTLTIANPLTIIKHTSREQDVRNILDICQQYDVSKIVIGQSTDEYGSPTFQGRKASRLAAAIKAQTQIPIVLWDEYESTKIAQAAQRRMKTKRKKRKGHLDEIAATVILQSYLDFLTTSPREK